MASLSIRIDLHPEGSIGPGKIELLEAIHREGSISAAGRAMDMSYRRAWDLVDETAKICGRPVVASQTGGKHGGGAKLTAFGEELIQRYRAIEKAAAKAAKAQLAALQSGTQRSDEKNPVTSNAA
ncbi:winged helix-turn-helix domain-containing protein [Chenggangzhangella methanolivorans]|uniref:winged helix-turn-helix domain-containing protein n=1 Tax=Chenggangzhangella methanolivorans TaxID=1437009 RepID=UPI00361BA805